MNLLTMEHITKSYTNRVLLDDEGFSINENEKIGVIGINGMGKSTLLKVAAGIEPCDSGKISMGGQVKICYLPQTPVFQEGTTILKAAVEGNVDELNRWTIEADAQGHAEPGWNSQIMKSVSTTCPAGRRSGWLWSMRFLRLRTSWYWTSRPTTWTMRCPSGWKSI